MPTQLTAPTDRIESQATLDSWALNVARNPNLTVDIPNTTIGATVTIRYADGSVSRTVQLSQNGSQLTAGASTAIRNFHNALVTYLRSQGLMPAGTDTSDF